MASGFDQIAPAGYIWAVTPSDSADLAKRTRGVWVGTAGTLRVTAYDPTTEKETAVTFGAVPDGTLLPICCSRIWSTGTTATNIVAMA